MAHESPKNFEKISILENVTAGFLLRCQNSLRWEISLICHWNIDSCKQNMSVGYVMVPSIDQNIIYIQYRLHLVRTICIRRQYLWKSIFFHAWKCIISEFSYQSKFWDLRRKPAVIFSKMDIFSKFFWIQDSHVQVKWR